ncbi:hypothetical protein [Arthrobacter sp. MMS18-M83]|uniref:hypothetical protein n=1 Tax=Arthrobacter sp. MMS18-M83 TaxID=2996261 RepID=UPI00227C32FC|nr:hypothetical protein [Arthrobacter sp. MMS18-M83]WAH99765.1 hypothetical protein OW521_23950 [Arthrobacter sp. MMS18-M83]
MGKASRLKAERQQVKVIREPVTETHEPTAAQDWPHGHVGVALTGKDQEECIEVTIHGVRHYLHSTTAQELSKMLSSRINEWNKTAQAAGFPGV